MWLLFRRCKPYIEYLELEDLWSQLKFNQKRDFERYERGKFGGLSGVASKLDYTSCTPMQYIMGKMAWAESEKNWSLFDVLLDYGNQIHCSQVDRHYFLQYASEAFYSRRHVSSKELPMSLKYALRDIDLFPRYCAPLKKEFHGELPRIQTFKRACIIYESMGEIEKAISICELAIKYELIDNTKMGYSGRLEKLKQKLKKQESL